MPHRKIARVAPPMATQQPAGRITCPKCLCRLDVFETSSGGRTVSVAVLSMTAEPKALERFMAPDEGPDIVCPACSVKIDPAAPYRRNTRRITAIDETITRVELSAQPANKKTATAAPRLSHRRRNRAG